MLTLILLVVLGGGAGLLAVSLIDSGGLSRLVGSRGASLRGLRGAHTPPRPGAEPNDAPRAGAPGGDHDPTEGADRTAVAEAGDAAPVHLVQLAEPPLAERPAPVPAAARDTGTAGPTAVATRSRAPGRAVPAAYTAVEGTYRDVAVAPWWRRLLSLLVLLVLLGLLGAAIAVLAGAAIGLAAELVDGAIG